MPGSSDIQALVAPEAVAGALKVGLVNARVRGAPWQTLAEESLQNIVQLLQNIETVRFDMLRRCVGPARAMNEMNEKVVALLEQLADAVWIERGQMPQDPLISILSPGTPNFFFDWAIGRPIDRLQVLLELFGAGQSETASSSEVAQVLGEIMAIVPEFQALNESVRALRAQLDVLEKSMEIVARIGHVQYSRLRRRMRAEGFEAIEVRKVFPDIPGASVTGTLS